MRKYTEILKGTWKGRTHRKSIFNILYNNEIFTLDPLDNTYFVFMNPLNFEWGYYIKRGRNFFLYCEEPMFYK